VVFFVFIVSNIGGSLTPIGDPPLFLGYLKGVPFWWVFGKCWPAWIIGVGGLISVFFLFDRRNFLGAPRLARIFHETSRNYAKKLQGYPVFPRCGFTWRHDGLAILLTTGC
jgi:Na+/H+ antiporter NhaD/arsenite permease-like protein